MTDTINIPRAELRGALRQLSFIRSYFHLNEYASAILEEQIEAFRARLAEPDSEAECRKSCTALCSGTGDMGGDWPCAKFETNTTNKTAELDNPNHQCVDGKCSRCAEPEHTIQQFAEKLAAAAEIGKGMK